MKYKNQEVKNFSILVCFGEPYKVEDRDYKADIKLVQETLKKHGITGYGYIDETANMIEIEYAQTDYDTINNAYQKIKPLFKDVRIGVWYKYGNKGYDMDDIKEFNECNLLE